MIGIKQPLFFIIFFISGSAILFSCNNTGEISLPGNNAEPVSAVTSPLKFSTEKKLTWDTASQGGIRSVIKKLDLDKLPSRPYDTSGFQPFSKPPVEIMFDFNNLPFASFHLDSLPSKPLQFKTTLIQPPVVVKALPPYKLRGKAIAIYDLNQLQGLPAKFITFLYKDKDSLLWISSSEGLFCYDGSHIQSFGMPSMLAGIVGMMEDNAGHLWFIRTGGIGMIDRHAGTISYSTKIAAVNNSLAKLTKDINGNLWVYNKVDSAISIIKPDSQTYKNLDRSSGLPDGIALEVLEDEEKNIWINTYYGGAAIITPGSGKIKYLNKTHGLTNDTMSVMAKDSDGQLWLADANGGLNAIDIKRSMIRQYTHLQGLKRNFKISIVFDKKGQLWAGTDNGLEIIDLKKARTRYIDINQGLAGNLVIACYPAGDNEMWIGTGLGLNLIGQNGETVHPLGNEIVISLMEDSEDKIWVGTDRGISIIDKQKGVVRSLNKSNGLANNLVQSFLKYKQQIWVSTNGGLDIIDPVQKTLEHMGKREGLVNDTIYVVFKDRENKIWLTGPSNGVNMIDSSKKIILHASTENGLSDVNIQDVKQDKEGLVWLATRRSGVDVYNPETGTIKNLSGLPGLEGPAVRMMLVDEYGRIWIGTHQGIYIADKKLGTITTVASGLGLSGNRVLSLQEYNGSVIAGTNNKAILITAPAPSYISNDSTTAQQWKIADLDGSEILTREQTNAWNTDLATKNGQYLWGDRGLTVIDNIKPNTDSSVTLITGLTIMNQRQYFVKDKRLGENDTLWTADSFYTRGQEPIIPGYSKIRGLEIDSVTGPYNLPVNLEIPYNNNYMQFLFGQFNSGQQDTVWYSYFLDGIDKNWSAPTANLSTENYLNLPPGNYIFKVTSKGPGGSWGVPATLSFTILPPWYKTWWAFALYALIAGALIRIYVVYRSRQLKKENKLLEEKVNLRTKQLQKSIEDLKSTQDQLIQSEKMASLGELTAGIAHEIQNPLNFVNNFSEVNTELIEEMKEEIEKGNFEEVKALAFDDIAQMSKK